MRTTRTHVGGRGAAAVLAALFAAAVALVGFASPASAHTVLLSSVPAAGANLPAAPTQVVLTYDEPVQASTLQMAVTNAGGVTVSKIKPEVDGDIVTQPLPSGLPNDTYTLAYRLVSVDGHPVSNQVTFVVDNPASTSPPIAAAAESASPSGSGGKSDDSKSSGGFGRIAGAATVLIVIVLIVFLGRRLLNRGTRRGL